MKLKKADKFLNFCLFTIALVAIPATSGADLSQQSDWRRDGLDKLWKARLARGTSVENQKAVIDKYYHQYLDGNPKEISDARSILRYMCGDRVLDELDAEIDKHADTELENKPGFKNNNRCGVSHRVKKFVSRKTTFRNSNSDSTEVSIEELSYLASDLRNLFQAFLSISADQITQEVHSQDPRAVSALHDWVKSIVSGAGEATSEVRLCQFPPDIAGHIHPAPKLDDKPLLSVAQAITWEVLIRNQKDILVDNYHKYLSGDSKAKATALQTIQSICGEKAAQAFAEQAEKKH